MENSKIGHFYIFLYVFPFMIKMQFLLFKKLVGYAPYSHCSSTPALRGCVPCELCSPTPARRGCASCNLCSSSPIFFLAKIKQILIRFLYMSDQEKKRELLIFIWVHFHYAGPNLTNWTSLWKISS